MGAKGITTKDWRAVREYCDAYNLIPQLSLPSMGQFIFKNRSTGEEVKVGLQAIKNTVERLKEEGTHA